MSTIAGLILAGGRSSRMGTDKSAVQLGGKPLLEHAVRLLTPQVKTLAVSANQPVASDLPVLVDSVGGHAGPLAGILAGLEWAATLKPAPTHLACVPVDAPFFPADLVAKLAKSANDRDIIVARCNGEAHPVFSLWPLTLAPLLHLHFAAGGTRKAIDFIESRPHRFVDFDVPEGNDPFMNINTPDDLAQAKTRLEHA